MAYNTPITAAGSSSNYTSAYKKHFGDRPVAFALSESRPSSSSSSTSHHSVSGVDGFASCSHSQVSGLDPFAAASSTSFACRSTEKQVGREEVVDEGTRTQLANLGWRIRATVNQGYSRTSTCHTGSGFVSERDVLRNVTNSRRGWSRVATAPTTAPTFDGMRCPPAADQAVLEGAVQKRSRRLSESDQEEEHPMHEDGERRIKGLPKLSFSSSTSSATSMLSTSPFAPEPTTLGLPAGRSKSFVRTHSERLPPLKQDTVMDEEMGDAYDFSSHFGRTDF
ncbi:hypothetical protein PSEUBRA_002054 [Kalmanozyma brasiliensis GHG001]|uniref:uncharacterized protein n=1 Tax=Kalmanozyma brasiliensis (strain GHG001) TaxID=1365824 RepID=UPI001CE820DD|nr:uncharacterized protein PSEUBRA_002054 [Kalmanozyma brasiliensis GHG001]KAF6767035.1 hypothetical protein PSEUBRA_002054 [Kalmanozyma brasiliensis GHG001]